MLAGLLRLPQICDLLLIEVSHWRRNRDKIITDVLTQFADMPLVVRSSARAEDGLEGSMAGVFTSIIDVAPVASAIASAIDEVIASYKDSNDEDQVLVQTMVENAVISGVVLTRELDSGGPYYVVNYDDYSGRTDTVTSGGESKTFLVHRSQTNAIHSARFRKLIDVVKEIEAATGCEDLDIEFCISQDDEVFVLQVRPLVANAGWAKVDDATFESATDSIRGLIQHRLQPETGVFGATTILAEMSDWNPAEMIGNAPRPLALSLYRRLITDSVWSNARIGMGYHGVFDQPLLVALGGRPYIDVRLSLNSLLPEGLAPNLAERLIDWQIAALKKNPEHHDKIEFEIAISCRDFCFPQQRERLKTAGFSSADIDNFGDQLWKLTNKALVAGTDNIDTLLAETGKMAKLREKMGETSSKKRVELLLEDCINFGTMPFSQLARHAFIGASLLRSLVARDAMTQTDMDSFMHAIETVAGEIVGDIHQVSSGILTRSEFLRRHGHLRPGTYDITSWRYDERPDMYLGGQPQAPMPTTPFSLSPEVSTNTAELLAEQGFSIKPRAMFDYIAASVRGREAAKFAFTRNISDALVALSQWGDGVGLSREDISFLTIDQILADEDKATLMEAVASARTRQILTRTLRLPHMIAEPEDIDVVRLPLGQPTFITSASVTGPVIKLASHEAPDIDGRVVFIEFADPGFDWIFSHEILGLVTKFGGANSHMSIRAAEFSIPAAIGCGERLFETLAKGSAVELNCSAHVVRLVSG